MASDKQRRTAEAERYDLTEELSSTGSKGELAIDKKKNLELALEGELGEKQTQSEMLMEHAKKNQISTGQLTTVLI